MKRQARGHFLNPDLGRIYRSRFQLDQPRGLSVPIDGSIGGHGGREVQRVIRRQRRAGGKARLQLALKYFPIARGGGYGNQQVVEGKIRSGAAKFQAPCVQIDGLELEKRGYQGAWIDRGRGFFLRLFPKNHIGVMGFQGDEINNAAGQRVPPGTYQGEFSTLPASSLLSLVFRVIPANTMDGLPSEMSIEFTLTR